MKTKILTGLAVALACGLVFLVVDCSCGQFWLCNTRVIDKDYDPAWTEYHTTTDSDGQTHTRTTLHPATWVLFCQDTDGPDIFRVEVTAGRYESTEIGAAVVVRSRQGRWTGLNYLKSIQETDKTY